MCLQSWAHFWQIPYDVQDAHACLVVSPGNTGTIAQGGWKIFHFHQQCMTWILSSTSVANLFYQVERKEKSGRAAALILLQIFTIESPRNVLLPEC